MRIMNLPRAIWLFTVDLICNCEGQFSSCIDMDMNMGMDMDIDGLAINVGNPKSVIGAGAVVLL